MPRVLLLVGIILVLSGTASAQCTTQEICVDHTKVELFDDIPETYIQQAAALRMMWLDKSVGANLDNGVGCLAYQDTTAAPNSCKRYLHNGWICAMNNCATEDYTQHTFDTTQETWSRAGGYDRTLWKFCGQDTMLPNPFCGKSNPGSFSGPGWSQIGQIWNYTIHADDDDVLDNHDVLSFQHNYLVCDDSTINGVNGFLSNGSNWDINEWEAIRTANPSKTFILWTTSLQRTSGETCSTFNDALRSYTATNTDIPFFDFADIISHEQDGTPCYDTRDGMSYSKAATPPGSGNDVENFADDALDTEAICQHYVFETQGGHLGNPDTGAIRVAKAFWVLMAMIAGWDPEGEPPSPPVLTLSASGISFPSTPAGGQDSDTLTLTNEGGSVAEITDISLAGTNSAQFGITHDCPVSPSTLASMANCTLTLTFYPTGHTGFRSANVSITADVTAPQADLSGIAKTSVAVGVGAAR